MSMYACLYLFSLCAFMYRYICVWCCVRVWSSFCNLFSTWFLKFLIKNIGSAEAHTHTHIYASAYITHKYIYVHHSIHIYAWSNNFLLRLFVVWVEICHDTFMILCCRFRLLLWLCCCDCHILRAKLYFHFIADFSLFFYRSLTLSFLHSHIFE